MTDLSYRLFYILAGCWRRRYVIAIPIVLLPFFGLLVAMTRPQHYQAHTSMLVQETAKLNPFLKDFAVSALLKERMSGLETLLHSRHILAAVALERGLIAEDTSAEEHDRVIQALSTSIRMTMPGKDLIRIDYQSSNAEGIKATLKTISKHFIEQLLAPERSSMKESTFFLAQHLTSRRKELDKAESAMAVFKDKNASALPELHANNVQRLAQLKQLLAERKAALAGVSKKLGSLSQQLSNANPVVGRIENQIVQIRGNLALLRSRYTAQHSQVQGAERTLRRLEKERQRALATSQAMITESQLWDIASNVDVSTDNSKQPLLLSQIENIQNARNKVEGLIEEIKRFGEMVIDLELKVTNYGEHEQEIGKLTRDLTVKRALYEELLERYEMARVTGSLGNFEQSRRIKVIDRPFTPSAPSNLPTPIFIISGLIGGILLGFGSALLLELTDNTIRHRDQLEAISGLPVICRIPQLCEIEG